MPGKRRFGQLKTDNRIDPKAQAIQQAAQRKLRIPPITDNDAPSGMKPLPKGSKPIHLESNNLNSDSKSKLLNRLKQ